MRLDVPRDRAGSFERRLVPKGERRAAGHVRHASGRAGRLIPTMAGCARATSSFIPAPVHLFAWAAYDDVYGEGVPE